MYVFEWGRNLYIADRGGRITIDENTAVREERVLGKNAWLWMWVGWLVKPSVGTCVSMFLVFENKGLTWLTSHFDSGLLTSGYLGQVLHHLIT